MTYTHTQLLLSAGRKRATAVPTNSSNENERFHHSPGVQGLSANSPRILHATPERPPNADARHPAAESPPRHGNHFMRIHIRGTAHHRLHVNAPTDMFRPPHRNPNPRSRGIVSSQDRLLPQSTTTAITPPSHQARPKDEGRETNSEH